jgi:hypothetical protein
MTETTPNPLPALYLAKLFGSNEPWCGWCSIQLPYY